MPADRVSFVPAHNSCLNADSVPRKMQSVYSLGDFAVVVCGEAPYPSGMIWRRVGVLSICERSGNIPILWRNPGEMAEHGCFRGNAVSSMVSSWY